MRVGSFVLESRLGRGAVGEVWRAAHVVSGEPVAVKLIKQGTRLAQREVEAVARLDHPGVVWIHDHGVDGEHGPWIALELASGGTLAQRLPLPGGWSALWQLLVELLAALAHAHARDVLHRDLKPANVLLCTLDDPRPGPKLADFTLARVGEAPGAAGGTPHYLAPEQRERRFRDEGPWTDVYALGSLAWAAACGGPPDTHAWNPAFPVPPGFEAWVARARAEEPRDRFRSAGAALRALQQLDHGGTSPPGPPKRTFDLAESPSRLHPRRSPASLGLFGLRPVPVVGRRREQAALVDLVSDAVAGTGPRLCRITGEPGIGKSHLLSWLAWSTREADDAEVLHLSGHDLRQALRRAWLARYGGEGRYPAELRERIVDVDDATAERVRAFVQDDAGEAVPLVLAWGEALGRPLVCLVDDVNRRSEADRWLPLLRRHASPRLALVVAGRQRGAEVDLLELPLGRLAAPAAVARALGVADPALAEAIGQRSGGLPSLAVAVARELARTDALVAGPRGLVPARGAHVALPAEVEREIQRRIPIGEADRSALEVLAMCGRAATEAIWQEACGARGVAWSTDLAESLRRAGMVVGQAEPRMADDLVQGMLLEEITEAGEGTGLATVVADVLERRPASPARNERLGELSLLAGRWARAAILLFGAAVQVELRDRPERSHLLLDQASRALDRMPDGPVVAELRAGIGLWRAGLWANEGDPAPALASLEGLRPLRGGYVAWRLTLLEAELRLRLGLVAGALEAARRAVDTASPDDERTADLLGEVLLHLNRPEETLAVIPPTGFAHPHRVGAHLALGDLDGAERELASPRPPDASWAAALHHAELETALRRGEPVWERLQVDWADPEWLDHPQHRAKLVILLSLAAVREHPDALGTLEAELREQLAVCGTRNGTFGRMIGEVADRIGPPLAERFRDLAASQEPIDLG